MVNGVRGDSMRDEWYGDKRDIVKWSTLVSLAREFKIRTILQITCYRQDEDLITDHQLVGGDIHVPIPVEVWQHFRIATHNIQFVKELEKTTNLNIHVYAEPFTNSRTKYFEGVEREIKKRSAERQIVFLDPDTGIAPEREALWKHVKANELHHLYDQLTTGDILVFYQHELRGVKGWQEITKKKFANAILMDIKMVKTYQCGSIAHDVVFFVVHKM